MSWGTQAPQQKTETKTAEPKMQFDENYYRNLFDNNRVNTIQHRMAFVGHENTLKTGLALSLLEEEIKAGKTVYLFDIDNSAKSTVDVVYPNNPNIVVLPLHDETDDSIFDEDNNVDFKALLDKTSWYVNILADKVNEDPDSIGGIIFDGGSTFLKWCEHAMRASLLSRGIIETEDGTFNQKEWRERNRLYRNVLTRLHSLNVAKVYFTFHLKAVSEYLDDGTGKKVLMTVGHRPEWEKGTMRKFSQQIFLSRYQKKADLAAGASRNTSTTVTIPINITNESYHWIVWADGYGNITESNELNNNMASPDKMVIGNDCTDLVGATQNDAGLGADAGNDPGNATNMGSNITGTYTGCMDGADGDDIYAFDVPSGYFMEVQLDAEDQNSDLDVFIHYSNGTEVDRGYTSSYPETATAKLTDYEGVGGTYYINVSHYSGISNYTLDVWTNQSIPAPDYTIDTVTSAGSGIPGDSFDVTAVLENEGTVDGVASVALTAILSVNTGVQWYDHEIGSTTTSGIPMNTNTSVTIPSTIPADIVEGGYYLYVVADQDDLILERDEDNNQQSRSGQFTVGNAETACASQNDAGMGGDAGNDTTGALDLGNYADAEYRGCMDSSDTADYYTITLNAGQNLNVTLVDPPSGAANLAIVDSSGNGVDSDTSWFSDAEVTTIGTSSEGVAGTYTLMINRSTSWLESGGAGTYRLLIGSPAGYTAPFSCVGHSDAGTGTDAGSDLSNAMILGANPTQAGQGCLDGQDSSDSYQFNLEDYTNVHVMFSPDMGMPFTANLYDEESNMVSGWNGTEWTSMDDMMYDGEYGG